MSTIAFVALFVQACLVQNVFSFCAGAGPIDAYGYGAGPYAMGPGYCGAYGFGGPYAAPFAAGLAEPFGYGGFAEPFGYGGFAEPFGYAGFDYGLAAPYCAPYGGDGIGNVAVAGELPVGGATAVAGQVPIIGAVEYAGPVCAAGTVTIAGNCACGCGGPFAY